MAFYFILILFFLARKVIFIPLLLWLLMLLPCPPHPLPKKTPPPQKPRVASFLHRRAPCPPICTFETFPLLLWHCFLFPRFLPFPLPLIYLFFILPFSSPGNEKHEQAGISLSLKITFRAKFKHSVEKGVFSLKKKKKAVAFKN